MLPSKKIMMAITGIAYIALGILCICNPDATVTSLAWLIGIICLASGIATFINWINLRHYFNRSGNLFLSAVMQILLGIIFLEHNLLVGGMLSMVFSFFLMFEGINLSVRSFDYKYVGFRMWWVNFVLGICAAVLGMVSLFTPGASGTTLSAFVGVGFIAIGVIYIVALCAVGKFTKKFRTNPWIDEQ